MGVGILFLLFKKRFLSIGIFSAYLLSGLIAQVLKYFIIEARPAIFLKDSHYQYFITDVTLHNYHSFPSGHTASAFALATFLALSFNNKILGLGLLLLAAAVGYSRMYLGQHFLIDVLSGSLIGVTSSGICWFILVKKMPAKYF